MNQSRRTTTAFLDEHAWPFKLILHLLKSNNEPNIFATKRAVVCTQREVDDLISLPLTYVHNLSASFSSSSCAISHLLSCFPKSSSMLPCMAISMSSTLLSTYLKFPGCGESLFSALHLSSRFSLQCSSRNTPRRLVVPFQFIAKLPTLFPNRLTL